MGPTAARKRFSIFSAVRGKALSTSKALIGKVPVSAIRGAYDLVAYVRFIAAMHYDGIEKKGKGKIIYNDIDCNITVADIVAAKRLTAELDLRNRAMAIYHKEACSVNDPSVDSSTKH